MSEDAKGRSGTLKVFISYAREDLVFAHQLVDAFIAADFNPLIDFNRMTGGEEFMRRLEADILESDTVVFIMSPDSLHAESFCSWEIAQADKYGKRIIPVIAKPLGDALVPPRLQKLDYIFFYPEPLVPGSGFGNGLFRLVRALNSDLDWLRQHSDLLQRAAWWIARRDDDSLLRGTMLADAEAWRSRRPKNAPEITELQREYLNESRNAEELRNNAERQRLEEMRLAQEARAKALKRAFSLLCTVAFLVLAMLCGTLWQIRSTNEREARVLTSVADTAFSNGYCDRALRLAVAGLPPPGATMLSPFSAELDAALSRYSSVCLLKLALSLKNSSIIDAAWSPDGQSIATVSDDRMVRIWNTATGAVGPSSEPAPSDLARITFNSDAKKLLVEGQELTFILDTTTLRKFIPLKEKRSAVRLTSFSHDGSKVLGYVEPDNIVKIWDAETGEQLIQLKGHRDEVRTARFSSDGSTVLTTSLDRTVKIWNAFSGTEIATIEVPSPRLVLDSVFSPNGSKFAITEPLQIRVFDTSTVKELKAINIPRSIAPFDFLTFSPNGSELLAAVNGINSASSWDAILGSMLVEFKGHTAFLTSVDYSQDGLQILTSSDDSTARIWDAKSGSLVYALKGHFGSVKNAKWSPDGRFVLTVGQDGQVRMWYTHDPSEVQSPIVNQQNTLLGHPEQ